MNAVKVAEIDFDAHYSRAKGAYAECAAEDSELFLKELGARWESISTRNESIRMTFHGSNRDEYLLEIKLELLAADGERIGWYCLHEDESGTVVDDFLVFE